MKANGTNSSNKAFNKPFKNDKYIFKEIHLMKTFQILDLVERIATYERHPIKIN
jgi:hypothetical protein